MSEKFSLTALEVEENVEPFEFEWGGEDFTIDAGGIDLRVVAFLNVGDWTAALELLLGDEEWGRFVAVKAVGESGRRLAFSYRRAQGLLDAYTAHLGTTLGKSRASRRSSKSTATPSKRTSSSTSRRGSRG